MGEARESDYDHIIDDEFLVRAEYETTCFFLIEATKEGDIYQVKGLIESGDLSVWRLSWIHDKA